jgi:amino acid transporter
METIAVFWGVLVWLIIFWLGSIFFEATGMERRKARFQALSAITGTGFTTTEAESVVNHPKRRSIATWLIFLGTTGLIAIIIAIMLFVRYAVAVPSSPYIIIMVITIVAIVVLIKSGAVNRLTNGIVRLIRKRNPSSYLPAEEIVHQVGSYGVARLVVSGATIETTPNLGNTGLGERGVTILAIERMDTAIPFPREDERLVAGDYLLCYGKVADLT